MTVISSGWSTIMELIWPVAFMFWYKNCSTYTCFFTLSPLMSTPTSSFIWRWNLSFLRSLHPEQPRSATWREKWQASNKPILITDNNYNRIITFVKEKKKHANGYLYVMLSSEPVTQHFLMAAEIYLRNKISHENDGHATFWGLLRLTKSMTNWCRCKWSDGLNIVDLYREDLFNFHVWPRCSAPPGGAVSKRRPLLLWIRRRF